MRPFQYLTIQDVLWINLQVTLKVESFDFARLEEAVFYQYALGNNSGLIPQASRFLAGFLRMKPFEVGNEATAFVACAAYLRLNGKMLTIPPDQVRGWIKGAGEQKPSFNGFLADADEEHLEEHLEVQAAIKWAMEAYLGVISPVGSVA